MTDLRLKTGETVTQLETYYGNHLIYQPYPEGIDIDAMDLFEINPSLPKVPFELWNKLMNLFYDYADQQLEVHARIVYDEYKDDWKVVIPTQFVTAGSATYNYTSCIDLVSGRQVSYPADLPTYDIIWHIHSHNTMRLKEPSGIDDKDELHVKQGYCVISNIDLQQRTYQWCFTVVGNDGKYKQNRRFFLPDNYIDQIVEKNGNISGDTAYIINSPYHNKVHRVIKRYIPAVVKYNGKVSQHQFNWLPKPKQDTYQHQHIDLFTRAWSLDDYLMDLVIEHGIDAVKVAIEKIEKEGIY